jgi:hypothetical protein
MREIVLIYKQRLQKERPEIEIPSRNSCSPRHKPLTEKYACVPLIFSPSMCPINIFPKLFTNRSICFSSNKHAKRCLLSSWACRNDLLDFGLGSRWPNNLWAAEQDEGTTTGYSIYHLYMAVHKLHEKKLQTDQQSKCHGDWRMAVTVHPV